MPTEDAYSSGHLVLFNLGLFGLTFLYVETSFTKHVMIPEFEIRTSLGLAISLHGQECLTDFVNGSMTLNSNSPPTTTGTVPSFEVTGTSVKMHLCCRKDGMHQDPIKLPKSKPFALLRLNGICQQVMGMLILVIFFLWFFYYFLL